VGPLLAILIFFIGIRRALVTPSAQSAPDLDGACPTRVCGVKPLVMVICTPLVTRPGFLSAIDKAAFRLDFAARLDNCSNSFVDQVSFWGIAT
jgi:hypothetical protein